MIDQVIELCCEMVYLALLASWRALPIFVVVAVSSFVIRNRTPARYVCWLWLIVIARLLLPVSIESGVGISSIADKLAQMLITDDEEVTVDSRGFDTFTFLDEQGKSVTVAILPVGATAEQQADADAYVAKITAEETATLASSASGSVFQQVESGEHFIDQIEPLLSVLAYSIAFGLPAIAIAMLLRGVISHLRFALKLWFLPAITERGTVDCLLRVCDDVGVGRRPQIKEVSSLHAPAVFGLLRAVVCLPKGWQERLTPEQLDWVFRHEMAHVKSRDGLMLFVASIAKSLHWFNPLSWIVVAKLQQQMERAADEMATRNLNESQIREYGELLLEFAAGHKTSRGWATVGLLAMAAPNGLQGRIESLSSSRPNRAWLRRLTLVPFLTVIAVCGLTDAKTIELSASSPRQKIPNFEVALAGTDWEQSSPLNPMLPEEERRTISINVENSLRKARELRPGIDAEKFVMTYFASFSGTAEQREHTKIVDGVMTVEVTARKESLIRQMLAGFEQSGPWQIINELRIMDTDVRLLSQFDWSVSDASIQCRRLDRGPVLDDLAQWEETFSMDASARPPQETTSFDVETLTPLRCRAIKISRLQSEVLIRQMQRDARSNILLAPKVTMFNGQCGMISDVVQRPFVTDVFAISGDLATALQPKISVFEDGWRCLMKTTVTKNEQVDLQVVLTHSNIDGVKLASLPRFGAADPDEEVTIQVPTVHSESIALASVLGADEALLVFSPKPYSSQESDEVSMSDRGMGQVFMIRIQPISDSDVLKDCILTELDSQ